MVVDIVNFDARCAYTHGIVQPKGYRWECSWPNVIADDIARHRLCNMSGTMVKFRFSWCQSSCTIYLCSSLETPISLPICLVSILLCHLLLRQKVKRGQPSNRLADNHSEHETFFQKLCQIDWIDTLLFAAGGILVLLALTGAPLTLGVLSESSSLGSLAPCWSHLGQDRIISQYIIINKFRLGKIISLQ